MSNALNSIRVLDSSLNPIAFIDDYQSAYFERGWHDARGFMIRMNYNALYADELVLDRIVMFGDDPYRCGVIEEVDKSEGPRGKGDMIVEAKGRECKALFERRYIKPPTGADNYSDRQDTEGVLKDLVKTQIGVNADTARKIALLDVATDQARGSTYLLSTRWKQLSEVLTQVSTATGVGHFIYLDLANKKYIYDIGLGVDRRSTQSVNGRAIFSSDYDTIERARLTKSNVRLRNLVYSAGQGIGSERLIETVYDTTEPTGFGRKEYFYDYRSIDSSAQLNLVGLDKLAELAVDTYIDGSALVYSQLVLGVDYNLGDLVTVETYGETIHPRIVGIRESWAPTTYRVDLTFDRNYPEFSGQTASNVSDLNRIMNQTELEFNSRITTEGNRRITSAGHFRRTVHGV